MKILIEHEGKLQPLTQWAIDLDVAYITLYRRWKLGERGETLLRPLGPTGWHGAHPRKHKDDFDYATRGDWYQSRGWKPFSRMLIAQANGLCSRCMELKPDRLEAHHREDPFPTRNVQKLLDLTNVEVVCSGCHRKEHGSKLETPCETCGKGVRYTPSRPRRFCSLKCRRR